MPPDGDADAVRCDPDDDHDHDPGRAVIGSVLANATDHRPPRFGTEGFLLSRAREDAEDQRRTRILVNSKSS